MSHEGISVNKTSVTSIFYASDTTYGHHFQFCKLLAAALASPTTNQSICINVKTLK